MAKKTHILKLGKSIVTVNVGSGDAQQDFKVDKALITARSRFFRNAMSGNWKEAEDGVVNLSEDQPYVFELYVQSLYVGHVSPGNEAELQPDYCVMLGALYVLADKLKDVQARNMIVQAIFEKMQVPALPDKF